MADIYDSSTQMRGLQPLVGVSRQRVLLGTSSGSPTEVIYHNLRCPRLRVNLTVHNLAVESEGDDGKTRVVLRHLYTGDAPAGTAVSQFLDRTLDPGETQYIGLNKVMHEYDKIVGYSDRASSLAVHVDYEFQS